MENYRDIEDIMRVLVVDDNPAQRAVMVYLLEEMGCEVMESENGMLGLERISRFRFDFVVMDWMMPEWNGGQTLKNCDVLLSKTEPEGPTVPVLVYSGQPLNLMQLPTCRHFQIRSYLSKKATPSQQRRLLHRFVHGMRHEMR